ncbi:MULTISPECIES: vWA domain-containing protein [Cylindrospermopsis]|uniref:vWA domain-containing protein n=1 Tax=Cylindrospermopsis TaxID=77021 RepID=UPI000711199D|nr:vWA domain-containing protein [Cylindrospermopsis sp. CR12]KRH95810.1 hypothetical protein ASL19_09550 [Cylindrospermopsis sp. CR12]MBU6345216.1 VWA domain-containing protein [Cyanobacteria bacterium REEB494]
MLNVVKKNYTLSYFRLKTCLIGKSLTLSLFLMSSLISPTLAGIKKAEIVDSPTIKDDRVTIKIKVLGEESRPVMGLERNNFELKLDGKKFKFKPKDWKSPEETVPPPAWIIVLLDFSGSMNQTDSGGSKKITGAINAIGQFAKVSSERGGDTQISIVPFGEAGKNCPEYPVYKDTLDKFISASDFKLQNSLEYLSTLNPCGSTNLYQPLKKSLQFLGNPEDPRFTLPENSSDPQPRLSIILLSDGYHNAMNEYRDFSELKSLLKDYENITVHTLGYGLTPEQLGVKYGLNRPATRQDVNANKVPEAEFVDKTRLAEIANLTGGIAEFSGDEKAIAENLQLFLNALLGEYQISYIQPNAERGTLHKVQVRVKDENSQGESKLVEYIMPVFGRSLPLANRLFMVISILFVVIVGGIIPFYYWGEYLKREVQAN